MPLIGAASLLVACKPASDGHDFGRKEIPATIQVAAADSHWQSKGAAPDGRSAGRRELADLFRELQQFKQDPEFHRVIYGRCCQFFLWKERVDQLSATSGRSLLAELGFGPGELVQLGSEYAKSRGEPTPHIRTMESRIRTALSSDKPTHGRGVLTTNGRWCTDVRVAEDFAKGMAELNTDLLARAESDPSCLEYPKGATVSRQLAERQFVLPDGSPSVRFVQVKASSGQEIWVHDTEVKFPPG